MALALITACPGLRPGLLSASRVAAPRAASSLRSSSLQMSTYATFKTSKGDFKAELFMDRLPVTSSNFADLAKKLMKDPTQRGYGKRPAGMPDRRKT